MTTRKSLRFCDGIDRRSFIRIGGLAMGGLALPQLLQVQGAAAAGSQKSVIMIFLAGGPPHQDMYDLKPDAPSEIRGEFKPISTAVPGIQICEHLPLLAARMDQLSIIRSLVGAEDRHDAFQCLTGWLTRDQPVGGWPAFGSVISKLKGPSSPGTPPFVSLTPPMKTRTWSDPGTPGFLGAAHASFRPNADGKDNLVLQGIDVEQLHDRTQLLSGLDRFRRGADQIAELEGVDAFTKQAIGILTSSRLAEALDLEKEDPKVRDRYGRGSDAPAGYGDAGPLNVDHILAARRLVEAGVRVVSLAYGRWDWHGQPHGTNFDNARDHLPALDQSISALLDDLKDRGLDQDVTVVVWGEFGRTPRINPNGGRDHWPKVASALLFGGGMRSGQVIGSTNRFAEHAEDRPVHFQEVFATLYRNMGININVATIKDFNGRPRYLVEHDKYQPMPELT